MRLASLTTLLLAAGAPLAAQSHQVDFATPVWTSPVEFTALFSVRELSDGRLIAPDPGERTIHLLGADGRPLGTIGRRGGGPQEFQLPIQALALPGDSTLINDRDQERFLLIGPDARPVQTIPWPTAPLGGDGVHSIMSADGRGNLYFPRSSFQPDQGRTPLLRWNLATGRFDSVQVLTMDRLFESKLKIEGHDVVSRKVVPFAEGDEWAVGPGGEVAVVRPLEYRLEWRAVNGTIRRAAPIPYRAAPVTAEERTERFGPGSSDLPIPATKPAVTTAGIRISPSGEIWVSRYPSPGEGKGRWDLLDREGRLLRSLTLPGRRTIIGFGRTMVYVARFDEDDIQYLEAYR